MDGGRIVDNLDIVGHIHVQYWFIFTSKIGTSDKRRRRRLRNYKTNVTNTYQIIKSNGGSFVIEQESQIVCTFVNLWIEIGILVV